MTRSVFESLQHEVHVALRRFGWDLRRVHTGLLTAGGWRSGHAYWDPAYVSRLGFRPRTLVDVGVGTGTRSLYDAFPAAYLVLIDPLPEFMPVMRRILSEREGECHAMAVGARAGKVPMNVPADNAERSSLLLRGSIETGAGPILQREVTMTTLDALLEAHQWQPPFGLKIDVEGFELPVLRGASTLLGATEYVIAEVPVAIRFVNGSSFAELIGALAERGFEACDFLDIGRADDSTVIYVDIVFRRMTRTSDRDETR